MCSGGRTESYCFWTNLQIRHDLELENERLKERLVREVSVLEAAGWRVGSAAEFLDLTKEEASLIEMKIGLADSIRKCRQARRLTQTQLAKRLGSSQSRVAKMEIADPSVSMDLLVRALLELGATRSQVAKALTKRSRRAA
jgi:plasmid maintenance system antidote protein VapI